MSTDLDRVLSCIQPTADMHFGNYFGAIENWVKLQDRYKCIYGIVDLHAITIPYETGVLQENTKRMFIDLMACGIDPEKSILFVQSLVPEHTELCWIFNSIASYGELTRMTQFKDKSQQLGETNEFISAGLFTYPILQAADILAYRPKFVPVGRDQGQHLELSRNIAQRFNHKYGEYFSLPETLFTETPKIMSLSDPVKKMSKSLGPNHFVALFEDEEKIRSAVKSAVTDSGDAMATGEMSPGVANLFEILKACGKMAEHKNLRNDFTAKKLKYVHLKQAVADCLVELAAKLTEKRQEILGTGKSVEDLMYDMSGEARKIAAETLREVRDLTGLLKHGHDRKKN